MPTEGLAESQHRVSIICRTMGRPQLQQALLSIAAQDYSNIEIILVDARGEDAIDYAAAGDRPVELVSIGDRLRRSAAANAGLDAAKGDFIQFLDDDDWLAPNHVSLLVDTLLQSSDIRAAYSNIQKTDASGENLGYVFEQPFDPVLLMRDNYIPIHAVLFHRDLLQHGCRFDEAFDIYEDWDFWIQLSQHTVFHHVDQITAYYREGGDSETAVEDVRLRYDSDTDLGRGRAALFDKWLPQWNGEQVNALIGQLDQSQRLVEQEAQIHRELKKNAELQHQLETTDMQLKEVELIRRDLESQLEQLQLHSGQQAKHVAELEQQLNSIYASKSWKIMGPVRRIGRAFPSSKSSDHNEQESDR